MRRLRVIITALAGTAVFQLSSLAGPIPLTGPTHTETFDSLLTSGGSGGGSITPNAEIVNALFWTGTAGADLSTGWWANSAQTYGYACGGTVSANHSRVASFGSSDGAAERAFGLGFQAPGGFGAQLQNNTGSNITQLAVSYDGEQWYRGNTTVGLAFEYSLDATSLMDAGATWIAVSQLDFTAPNVLAMWTTGDGNLSANRVAGISHVISGLNIADGATFFIRWGADGTGNGLGIDNVSITPNGSGGGSEPEPGPPFFHSNPVVKTDADVNVAYTGSLEADVSEADGDTVTFTKLSGPAWLSVTANGGLSGTPLTGDEGLNVFTVEASDVDGASTGTIHITVIGEASPVLPGGTVNVDVNWNIEHSVNGISDFGRERHITVHSSFIETDWDGEEDKMDYLMNDLDVYFGRDNGSVGWKFRATEEDPDRANMADLSFMTNYGTYLRGQYDLNLERIAYEDRQNEMIMGTTPHPSYPTLSWFENGSTWTGWQPMDIETSAEWMVEYLDQYFRKNGETSGEQLPMYWEVINEPDMELMTGQFMVSNWESLWEYHNLVAAGVRERLGDEAPLIGGMTWGLHDLWQGDLPRYDGQHYYDLIVGNDPSATNGANFYKDAGTTAYPTGDGGFGSWEQWDVVWKGFIDHAGSNMDFYAVHLYDWPAWETSGSGTFRHGGPVEATLDTLEWYDVHENGVSNRKPVVLSEYGAVGGSYQANTPTIDRRRQHWENLKPFSSMMMQFLERPDYVVKSMPFTPVKATWGDYYVDDVLYRYPSTMLDETSPGSGVWEWSEFIKWYELWSDVDGIRVDTIASDLDMQVDAYVDGNRGYLILNNLEPTNLVVNLNSFGLSSNTVSSVQIKHLYLDLSSGTDGRPVLSDQTVLTPPGSVEIGAEATMILCYAFADEQMPDETAQETKFYGESLSGTEPFRVEKASLETLTAQINGVTVPTGDAEAVLRISGLFIRDFVMSDDARNVITINGNALDFHGDWRGESLGNPRWFGTIEIPVPKAYLQTNNSITCEILNNVTYSCVSLQVTEFSQTPGRSASAVTIPVTGISVSPSARSIIEQRTDTVKATLSPADASDKRILWSSDNTAVATVDELGVITAVSAGSATITATAQDGGYSDTAVITVNPFVPFGVAEVAVHPAARVIRAGETAPLTKTVYPANAATQTVSWSSDNPSVATVDASGVVTAVAEGTALITATSTDGGLTDTSIITVPPPIAVTEVELAPANRLIAVGDTVQLNETVLPSAAADPSVTWTSLNPAVATVSSSGLVTGVAGGSAQIVVTTVDGGFSATNETTVFDAVAGGSVYTVEAESFFNTGGVSNSGVGINYVEANDWAEYHVTLPEDGIYKLEYVIASPNDGSGIEFLLDGVSLAGDDVPNTGAWDAYVTLQSASYFAVSNGSYVARVAASSSPAWQWNLDKFILTRVDAGSGIDGSVMALLIQDGNIVLSVTNGPGDAAFALYATTNLVNGPWEVVESNLMFNASGEAVISNTLPALPQEYFRIDDVPSALPSGISALFDWAEFSGNWWEGYNYAETNNGVVMISGGRAAATAADGGTALKAAYAQDAAPGTFVMQIDGEEQVFRVNSIQIEANRIGGGVTNAWIPSVEGYLGGTNGVQVWAIIPTQNTGLQTYTSATSGDLSQDIDVMIWNTGEAADPGTTFGNTIDNLNVTIDTP
ncbi:Ig-like domain-containing protein [Pontiella sp. NLcol2]|uniref:Ig-like domain-containing protein n=2 Tax=Pontiella agarivorans TaxID=3038953 RepID=A0ABU5MUB0_9BACT|nr:Ig-like domain-containing protein [Pontiella agarivorans]